MSECDFAIVTTAAPFQPGKGDRGPGAVYNGSTKFYRLYSGETSQDRDLRISLVGCDRTHTAATGSNTWFPLPALRRAAAPGRIGGVAARFHGAPTNRGHRVAIETDAPELPARPREDRIDAVILVPNRLMCHQTTSLAARHIEANVLPTILMGYAKDIVEHAAVPRFVFSDFPVGNAAGKPREVPSQDRTLELWRYGCWNPRPAHGRQCKTPSAGMRTDHVNSTFRTWSNSAPRS